MLFIAALAILAYSSIGVFGLLHLNHSGEMPMMNCPYSQGGSAICKNTLDHINDWREFSLAIILPVLLFSILAFTVLFFFKLRDYLKLLQYQPNFERDPEKQGITLFFSILTRWLALFENSPNAFVRTQS